MPGGRNRGPTTATGKKVRGRAAKRRPTYSRTTSRQPDRSRRKNPPTTYERRSKPVRHGRTVRQLKSKGYSVNPYGRRPTKMPLRLNRRA